MFSGSHVVIFSSEPEADRVLMAKLMGRHAVDAGEGWMIYEMPPAEVAVHPPYGEATCELHMMCDDIDRTIQQLSDLGLTYKQVEDMGYGLVSSFQLPGGTVIGFYQPRHVTAI